HGVEQRLLNDRTQAPRAGTTLERATCNGGQCLGQDLELDLFHFEQLLELLDQRVLGLDQNAYQRLFVQLLQCRSHRQTTDQLGNQTEFDQIFGLYLGEQLADAALGLGTHGRGETDARFFGAVANDLFQTIESPAHN